MRTIETTAVVTAGGGLTLPNLPPLLDLPPGLHRVVLVIEEPPSPETEALATDFPVIDIGPWPENLSLRRENMYDDWGR